MTLVCDTSGLIAYFDADDARNAEVSRVVDAEPGPFVVSPYVVAELDYLVSVRRGTAAQRAVLAELSTGAWTFPCCDAVELRAALDVIDRYADQEIGLTDASLVVLAGRFATERVLTLDDRHFRVLRALTGPAFTVLPADA